jgi:putative transposase
VASRRGQPLLPSDLTDQQGHRIAPLLPPARPGGRPRTTDLREIVNAIRFWQRSPRGWRQLPSAFPAWGTVHYYYRRWVREGLWQRIERTLEQETDK